MKLTYFKQKPSEKFRIIDKINLIYSNGSNPTLQIFPFKVLYEGKEYQFEGLSGGVWSPVAKSIILAEISDGEFHLTIVTPDMLNSEADPWTSTLGIIIYLDPEEVLILDHRED